jgi:hypothetical protein
VVADIVFSKWQKRVIWALMICEERWSKCEPPRAWAPICRGSPECGRYWRFAARRIERHPRWGRLWGDWLSSGLWRGDWRANLANCEIMERDDE